MNRVIVDSVNKYINDGNDLSRITKQDIWNYSTETIYKYYSDESDFYTKFDVSELEDLYHCTCISCGKSFVRISRSRGQCNDCINKYVSTKSPSLMPHDTTEYKSWFNKQQSALPQKSDDRYDEWYKNVMESHLASKPEDSEEYKRWYESLPNGKPKDSKEYIDWYNSIPSTYDKDSNEYKDWFCKWSKGNANKDQQGSSSNEQRLMNLKLPYVIRNEVGQECLEYQYDDKTGNFYPDFKIQISYGTDPKADWEFIEYKGDHLLKGIYEDQSHGVSKYNSCHDRVGFVPSSYSWLFEWCITNPYANELWPNPRILAYAIYYIWENDSLPEINWNTEINILTEYIRSLYMLFITKNVEVA